jgi:hypothetical protein
VRSGDHGRGVPASSKAKVRASGTVRSPAAASSTIRARARAQNGPLAGFLVPIATNWRQPARAEKGALPLTGAPGEDGPGGGRSGHRVEAVRRLRPPQWAVGRPVARPHRRGNQPARVNPTLLLPVLVDRRVNVTRR